MMSTIPQSQQAAVLAVRTVECPVCFAGIYGYPEPCSRNPDGNHVARWSAALSAGLVTSGQFAAAVGTGDIAVAEVVSEASTAQPTAAELAARVTAAAAARGDFQREQLSWAMTGGAEPGWQDWAVRLSAELASVLAGLQGPRACASCGVTSEPLAGTRSRRIGEMQWRELWRCQDVAACQARLFPGLASLLAGAGTSCTDGDVEVDVADVGDGTEPYCMTCGEWIGIFQGDGGWRHYRGDPAPGGGGRDLFEAGHEPVIGWIVPPWPEPGPAAIGAQLPAAGPVRCCCGNPCGRCGGCDDCCACLPVRGGGR